MPDGRQQEQHQARVERQEGSGERDAEPELRHQEDVGGLHRADDHRRSRLADHDLDRPQGRDLELVEGPLLPLPRHRQRRQHDGLHHGQGADQRRDHVPARFEIGIVPSPRASAGLGRRDRPCAAASRR